LRAHVWFHIFDTEASFDLPLQYGGTRLGRVPDWISMQNSALDCDLQINWSFFESNLLVSGLNYRWLGMEMEGNDPEMVHQHRFGVFLQDEQRLFEQLLVLAGVRMDYNSITPLTFSPRAAVVWRYNENQSLRAAFGMAFRKPSFFNTSVHLTDVMPEPGFEGLVGFMRRSIGNENLANEKLMAFEIGYRGRFIDGALILESDIFYNRYRDTISFNYNMEEELGLPDLETSSFRFDNIGMDVDSVGGSLSVVYRHEDLMRLSANYTYRYSWYIAETNSELYAKGDRVPWEPAHLFNASATFFPGEGIRLGAAVYARSHFDEPWHADGGLFGNMILVGAEPVAWFSAFAAWRMESEDRWLEAGVRAYNLGNQRFRDLTSVERFDGKPIGGQPLGRIVFVFLRGGI